ncbi:MAG: hypothetical protein JJU45_06285 [Acidimicrobiia bacterium]|nr:hypothetical protein [Acidimicrobiia bacterium]
MLRRRKHRNNTDGDRSPVVIGREMARAHTAEQAHRSAHPTDESPLAGLTYDRWAGDFDLTRFSPNATDDSIRSWLESWPRSQDRVEGARPLLTMDDFYTLLTFAQRSTVRSLQQDSGDWTTAGVLALPLIACDRVDWRDLSVAAAMTAWALRRTRQDVLLILNEAAGLADEQAAEILRRFAGEPPDSLADWGYQIVHTGSGAGLAHTNYAPYQPSVDLTTAALAIADVLDADHYLADRITVAAEFPDVWCRGPRVDSARAALERMPACVTVGADPRPETGASPMTQMLTVWIAEMASASDANVVADAARAAPGDHARVAFHDGPLCCVLVARSFQVGTAALEDQGTVGRLEPALRAALSGVAR